MTEKIIEISAVPSLIQPHALIGIGGVLLRRKPMSILRSLTDAKCTDLNVAVFLGSIDIEWLAAHGSVSEVTAGYVGFESFGSAPAWSSWLKDGQCSMREMSEFMFIGGLRASCSGIPFMPSRGASESQLVNDAKFKMVTCPYTGEELYAIPALTPDISFIHAESADRFGNVAAPSQKDFLWDADAILARASKKVIVSVEKIVDTADISETMLFAHEVSSVVLAPNGASPSGLPGLYQVNHLSLLGYLEDAKKCFSQEDFSKLIRSLVVQK
jgi:glutaconate CoA-transferase subunit A